MVQMFTDFVAECQAHKFQLSTQTFSASSHVPKPIKTEVELPEPIAVAAEISAKEEQKKMDGNCKVAANSLVL
jgi:hypothetical protein